LVERVEETELAFGCPAIASDSRISSLAHRPAWITKEGL
jgi:hypothetical protein